MLLTVSEFREAIRLDIGAVISALQSETGRGGAEERHAWEASLPQLSRALSAPGLEDIHLYFAGHGYVALEYQLPAASFWCDVVLLGRKEEKPSAVIVELKHWITRGDKPGPVEGLIDRGGTLELHPSDQVRGYTEYCRRFHSTIQERNAEVRGCVLFTRDYFVDGYVRPPNDVLAKDYPCFTLAPNVVQEEWASYLTNSLEKPDTDFAKAFVQGTYKQDRGFVRQIGEQIRDRKNSPFELLDHQRHAVALVRARLEEKVLSSSAPKKQVVLIKGPPGSGKSVVAARVWSDLVTDSRLPDGSAVMVTTSAAQTSNWSKLFQIAGGATAANGVVKRATSFVPATTQTLGRMRQRHGRDFANNPENWKANIGLLRAMGVKPPAGANDDEYLVSVVDEAHALINPEHVEGRGQFGFAPTLGPLAWHIIRCSTVSIFLLDSEQGFRDRENTTIEEIRRWAEEQGAEFGPIISLEGSQFRCAGSVEYVEWLEGLLAGRPAEELAELARVWRSSFQFEMFGSPALMEQALRQMANAGRSTRLLASYARKWVTKDASQPHSLPENLKDFREPYIDESGAKKIWGKVWNFLPRGTDYTWFIQAPIGSMMSADPLCEVGCPYVVRGFDFDHIGVLWLSDLVWREGRWVADHRHVHDTGLDRSVAAAAREGQARGAGHEMLRSALAQAYRILLTRGMRSCDLWVEDDQTRSHIKACLGEH